MTSGLPYVTVTWSLQAPLLLQGICGGGAWAQGLGELGKGGGGGEPGLLSPQAHGRLPSRSRKQVQRPWGRPCFTSRQSWIAGQAEMLLALEDTRPGGHMALETPGLDANPEHQEKLDVSEELVTLC